MSRSEQEMKDLLRSLTLAAGAPGAEDEVRALVRENLGGVGELSYDSLGSILCEKSGAADSPRVMIDGHMDEVGFMVQSITKEGRINFVPLGGWWAHVLLSQRVDIVTSGGKVPGVIGSTPPHFLSGKKREQLLELEDMYIDIGADSEEGVSGMGVRIGDTIVPHAEFTELNDPDILSSKAFDNRVGIGLMIETLLEFSSRDHPNTIIGVGAAQEEIGCRGAVTACEKASPDVGIVLEGTPADDIPGFNEPQAILGKGPQIRFYDPTAISNRRLAELVAAIAEKAGIEIQLAVRRSGGTDAKSIHLHRAGVPTVVIGVPARYIHSHVSLISWQDYLNTGRLVRELIAGLDSAAVESLTDFS
ncbi:MAG: M42 family metallopeptidase [Planctomycetes bacterium]|nr:M42 family metallopeptidase [Planctomycetota bacterium]